MVVVDDKVGGEGRGEEAREGQSVGEVVEVFVALGTGGKGGAEGGGDVFGGGEGLLDGGGRLWSLLMLVC